MAKHRPLRTNTETALELADEVGKLVAKKGTSCRNIRERTDQMKLYLVEYFINNKLHNMIVRAKNHDAAENQVKVSMIARITDDNF